MTTAGQIMHSGAQCIPITETLDRAAQLMREQDVGCLPVCDTNGRLAGMITDRDIVVNCVARGREPARVTAEELAQGTPMWIDVNADVEEVLQMMENHRIRRLPVIKDKKLVGIISEADLARHLKKEQVAAWAKRVYAE